MQKTGLELLDKQIVLTRFDHYKEADKSLDTYDINNPWTWKTIDKTDKHEDVLAISTEGFEVLVEWFYEENSFSYCAWVKNFEHVFYISISRKAKTKNQPVIKKVNLKPKFFNEIEVVDEDFIKTQTEVFYIGKKINGALARSFRRIENTHFYEDETFVYSYTETDGLAKIEIPTEDRFFIPYTRYFADREKVYRQSGWTNKIEPVSGRLNGFSQSDLWEVLKKNGLKDENVLVDLISRIKTYEELFAYFFPNADAKWNVK